MSGLLKGIFEGLAAAFIGWLKGEQAVANEWAAKSHKAQMDSMIETLDEEKMINTTPIEINDDFSVDDWNAGAGELV
jgi:hypothetical protein